VLVVTSDHGAAFGERGQVTDGRTFHPEVYAVALLVRGAGRVPAGARIDAQVRSIDVVPTLLALVGLPRPPSVEGEALLPMEPGAIRPRADHGAVGLNCQAPDRDLALVVSEDRLYIRERRSGAVEFYDLRADPGAPAAVPELFRRRPSRSRGETDSRRRPRRAPGRCSRD
jgi:arylsulfatase A-like enzyme